MNYYLFWIKKAGLCIPLFSSVYFDAPAEITITHLDDKFIINKLVEAVIYPGDVMVYRNLMPEIATKTNDVCKNKDVSNLVMVGGPGQLNACIIPEY